MSAEPNTKTWQGYYKKNYRTIFLMDKVAKILNEILTNWFQEMLSWVHSRNALNTWKL